MYYITVLAAYITPHALLVIGLHVYRCGFLQIPDAIIYIAMIQRINTKKNIYGHNGNSLKRIKEVRMEIRAGTKVLFAA